MAAKPIFILHGRIVPMTAEDDVIDDGYLAVKNGAIAAIVESLDDLPDEFAGKPLIETEGTIYPGLIDLHNHFVYNVLPLWVVPKRYDNRSQWPAHPEYKAGVSKPIKQALAKYSVSAKAMVRYVEAKVLISGTTTGQGMRTQVKGGEKIFEGAMRNVEEPGDQRLLPAGTMVPDLVTTGSTAQERIDAFRRSLNNPKWGAYFYHLSEGVDNRARQHFVNLKDYDLIGPKLVGIHSLGLQKQDLVHLARKGAKVVWSPFSNQLLYGKTIDLQVLKDSGVQFSLGCDWTPSGSKNMLQELKVAYHTSQEQGDILSPFELVQAATVSAAAVVGWEDQLGTLEEDKLADLLVIKGVEDDPYMQLIRAVEKDVELVVVDGTARYGSLSFMKKLHKNSDGELEEITVGKQKKALYLYNPNSLINDITFSGAMETLEEAMQDLPAFVNKMEDEGGQLMDDSGNMIQEFTLELDNEFEIESDVFCDYEMPDDADLLADVPMADAVEFDTPVVEGKAYWDRIMAQKNISDELKDWLRECYQP